MYWPNIGAFDWDWDPFSELSRVQRDVNRLFGSTCSRTGQFPAVNVWSNRDEAVVTAEVPGVNAKDLSLKVIGDTLSLEGERQIPVLGEKDTYHRQERGYGRFARSIRLPFEVQADQIKARYEKGVLNVTLPRAESSKPKKIEIAVE